MATPAKIATLRDVLSLDRKGKELFVEIKTNYSKEQRQESLDYAKKLLSFCSQFNTENITFIGRDVNTLMAIKEKDSSFDCLPVIGYDDAEKALCGLDGVSVAQNHLEKRVPGTDKLLFEYFAEKGDPIAIWTIDTLESYQKVNSLLRDVENCYPTSNFSDLLKSYDEDGSPSVRHR